MKGFIKSAPVKIVFCYTLLAGLWIFLSDSLLESLSENIPQFSFLQTIKGWLFVAITSMLLYFFIKKMLDQKDKIIESQKRTEKELKVSTELFNNYFENALDLFCIADQGGTILRMNKSWEKVLGYNLSEMENHKFMEFIHPDDMKATLSTMEKLSNNESVYNFSNRYISKDGSYKRIEWKSFPSENLIYAAARDITEKYDYEEKLKEEEEKYRLLVQNQTELIVKVDAEGKFLYVSPSYCQLFGMEESELLNKTFMPLVHENDREKTAAEMEKLYHPPYTCYIEQRAKTRLGWRWLAWSDKAIVDENGNIKSIVGAARDITEQKNIETALQESELLLRKTQEIARLGSYVLDVNSGFWTSSRILDELFGIDQSSVKNVESWHKLIKEDMQKEMIDYFLIEVIEKKNRFDKEYIIINQKTGKETWVHGVGELIMEKDNPVTMIGTIKDITDRKLWEISLKKAKDQAEQADKLKSEFLAQMSHEIRSPINTILNSVALIREELSDSGNEIQELFPILDAAGKRIIKTIDSILNMSELQLGIYEPSFKIINLNKEIFNLLVREYKYLASLKYLDFNYNVETENTDVYADIYSVGQIFANLFDNAIKYTNEGGISVKVSRDNKNRLSVVVSDTGIGISKEFIPVLFSPFRQELQGYSRKYEGNGLGLALIKRYCAMNKAVIEVQSEKNKGSVFTIIFDEQVS